MARSRFLSFLFAVSWIVVLAGATVPGRAGEGHGGGGHGASGGRGEGGGHGEGGGRGEGGGGRGGEHGNDGGGKGDKSSGEREDGRSDAPTSRADLRSLLGLATDDATAARLAFAAGRIRPLAEILGVARGAVPGRVLGVELHQGFLGGWTYRVTMLGRDGRYSDLSIDAERADLLDVRRR